LKNQTIIVDENIPNSVAKYLNLKGFKTLSICEDFLKSERDSLIAEYASKNGMQVLTLDSDFAQLYHNIFRGRITVLLIKTNPTTAENIIKILALALEKIRKTEIKNKLVIITKKRVRIVS
jgi:predicted nuclease of predicted toxin-antitoxin system